MGTLGSPSFEVGTTSVFLLCIDEHAISLLVHTNGLHSAKAKQINATQTPTPNAETTSDGRKLESIH